jgi:hypothetical protein
VNEDSGKPFNYEFQTSEFMSIPSWKNYNLSYFNSVQWCFSCSRRSNSSHSHNTNWYMLTKASSIPYSEISVILVEAPFQTKKGIYGYLKKFHWKRNSTSIEHFNVFSDLSRNRNIVTIPQTVWWYMYDRKDTYNLTITPLISKRIRWS